MHKGRSLHHENDIIKQIQRDLSCPVCSKKFELTQIKIKASFDQVLVVQTICPEGHATLFMTIFNKLPNNKVEPINTNDVLDFSNSLNNFNGDFDKIWKMKG